MTRVDLLWNIHCHEHGYVGQRMTLPQPGVLAHECTDTAGMVYFEDGGRTSWYRSEFRESGPSWTEGT
jgi:hypothetical protein